MLGASGEGTGIMAYQSDDPNEAIWGPVYRGLALSIFPQQEQYALGDEIEIAVFLKNLRTEKFFIAYEKRKPFYRMAMFDSAGKPVKRTDRLRQSEAPATKPKEKIYGLTSSRVFKVDPWTVSTKRDRHRVIYLNNWFKIDKPGTYTLIVMQPIANEGIELSWKDGFLISNAAKINIVAK
jgi:hypothetical protein